MDTKTPVTLLQELLLKKGTSPDYVLLHNGVGTHDPLFVYEVSGVGKTAVGRGKSKREAKHAAAQELLYMISDVEKKLEAVVQSPYADVLKENAIGALQDFCVTNMIGTPTYEQIRDEGLPHAKLFGVKCAISSFTTQAEARTKKQAKQIAAQLMLAKLKACLQEDIIIDLPNRETQEKAMAHNESIGMEKIEEYFKREERPAQPRPLGTPLDHFDQLLKQDLFLSSETFDEIKGKERSYFEGLEDPGTLFTDLMQQLDLVWEESEFELNPGISNKVMCIQVRQLNNATFFGMGDDKKIALRAAFISGLQWLAVMGL